MNKQLLKEHYFEILGMLENKKIIIPRLPKDLSATDNKGDAIAIAYPIQGLLKYHGMADFKHRIANFPSISLNNNCASTLSYASLDPNLKEDRVILNNMQLQKDNSAYQRISYQLDTIRQLSEVKSHFLILSKNIDAQSNEITSGKGLGTSASGGAAIAAAVSDIIYRSSPEKKSNMAINCHFARYLAGSATRSAVGGIGLWLAYPGASPEQNIALRLNEDAEKDFNRDWALITVSIPADFKTDQAHRVSLDSPFYGSWAYNRKEQIVKFISALEKSDFDQIGEMAEFDTMCLHSVTMTSHRKMSLILWSEETLKVIHYIHNLRKSNISAYFSIDTGPSVVIITKKKMVNSIVKDLKEIVETNSEARILVGGIGSKVRVVSRSSDDVRDFVKEIQTYAEG